MVALFNKCFVSQLKGVVVKFVEHDEELEVNLLELEYFFTLTLGGVSANLKVSVLNWGSQRHGSATQERSPGTGRSEVSVLLWKVLTTVRQVPNAWERF